MSRIIGIDFGTKNTRMAIWDGNKPSILKIQNQQSVPSIISVVNESHALPRIQNFLELQTFVNSLKKDASNFKFGEDAKKEAVSNPQKTIAGIKKFLYQRETNNSQGKLHYGTYRISPNSNGYYTDIILNNIPLDQQIAVAYILNTLKNSAESSLGGTVAKAVISVPASFNSKQREIIVTVGKALDFDIHLVNESTAALLTYAFDRPIDDLAKVAVVSVGAGSFEVSIVENADGYCWEVLSNEYDMVGGDDFDDVVVDWLLKGYSQANEIVQNKVNVQRLKEAAEKAKIELTTTLSTNISIPNIAVLNGTPLHIQKTLTRSIFDELTAHLVKRIVDSCKKIIKNVNLNASDLTELILVGGASRIPKVMAEIESSFGKKAGSKLNYDDAVVKGTAIYAARLENEIPDPFPLLDILTSGSIGIETLGGVATKLIDKHTILPARDRQVFSTASDNQSSVSVYLYQGEREMAKDNDKLAKYEFPGIMNAPRGVPQVEVSFDINSNGILSISANLTIPNVCFAKTLSIIDRSER